MASMFVHGVCEGGHQLGGVEGAPPAGGDVPRHVLAHALPVRELSWGHNQLYKDYQPLVFH